MNLQLIKPTVELKDSYMAGLRAFRQEDLPWYMEANHEQIESDFPAYVQAQLDKALTRKDGSVPETELWAVVDGQFVGKIKIRHELNDALRVMGGNIGYDTVPAFRGRGIATLMLHQALPLAKRLGLSKVLLTCDETNLGSIRVIEKNGGVLEKAVSLDPTRPLKRYYWIDLSR